MLIASTSVAGFGFRSGKAQFSALPPKADIKRHDWHVRFVPISDIARLLNHLVGTRLQR